MGQERQIKEYVDGLYVKDNMKAYENVKKLIDISESTDEVYPYMDTFAEMLADHNSYVRNRGIMLIAANARWDLDNKLDEIIDEYLLHVTDDKPITSRQCLKGLVQIAEYKPELSQVIKNALIKADISRYADTMRPLIEKDMKAVLDRL